MKQRIALVAVSALTAGVLSVASAPVANAATGDFSFSGTLATALPPTGVAGGVTTAGVCAVGLATAASPTYISVGGSQAVVAAMATSSVASNSMTITGNAVWQSDSSQVTSSKSADNKSIITAVVAETSLTATMSVTGTGPIQISLVNAGVVGATKYFIGVPSCTTAPDMGRSFVAVQASFDAALATNVDASAATTVAYAGAGQISYINYTLNDAYGAALTATTLGSSVLTASTTGGCTIGFGSGSAAASSGAPLAVATNGANTYKYGITVFGDNTPRVCVVTASFNGTTIINKTITMTGDVTKVTVDPVNSSANFLKSAALTNGMCYKTYDSAGNLVVPTHGNFSISGTGSLEGVSQANGTTYTAAAMRTYGFACVTPTPAARNGAGTWALTYLRPSDGVSVKSDTGNATVADGGTATFTAGWDKAAYNIGDVAKLTITAKDAKGNLVADGTTLTGLVISVGGATQLGTAASASDTTTGGSKSYNFAIGTIEAQFAYSVALTSLSAQAAVTGTYKATTSTTTVSNAEVLKSIVALIASINKQIQALQKLILARR
jgi:hypothetical protein